MNAELILESFTEKRHNLLRHLRESPSGLAWTEEYSALVDEVIRGIYAGLAVKLGEPPPVTVVATGGYGRQELSPCSDVDLTLVPINEGHPLVETSVKSLYISLQEIVAKGANTKIGYALRYASDAPGLDGKTRSGLLDSRVVAGPKTAYDELMGSFWESFPVAEFLIEKRAETEENWKRTNDSPLAVHPNLKLGAGGLRSFQAANWIGAALGERMDRPTKNYDAVVQCRNLLHLVAQRPTDLLTHEKRAEVAGIMGLDPLAFGSVLASDLACLLEIYYQSVQRIHEARFPLAPNVESIRGEARIGSGATAGNAALGIAHATRLGLRVSDSRVRPLPQASASEAIRALSSGEETIRNLDKSGVLDVLLPELTACRTLMPQDASHEHSVFEHTIRVVRNLEAAPVHPFFGQVSQEVSDKGPLFIAALLHDVGRSEGEATHAETGALTARQVCERWGMYSNNADTVCWLVREHLTFDRTLRLRDLSDPRTAGEFARHVGTGDRLNMLALLTWADINAVAPHTWTASHEALSQELIQRTKAVLNNETSREDAEGQVVRRHLKKSDTAIADPVRYARFIESMPAHYLLGTDPETAQEHFRLVESARNGEATVLVRDAKELGVSEVTVCCRDHVGLLSEILGVFYANDLSLVGLRASTSVEEPPIALDTFHVSQGGRLIGKSVAARVKKDMLSVVRGETLVADLMRGAMKDPDRSQQFLKVKYVEGDPGIIEVIAPRGRGLPYRLSRQLATSGIEIVGARVSQWADQGAAAFYVKGMDGASLDEPAVTRALTGV